MSVDRSKTRFHPSMVRIKDPQRDRTPKLPNEHGESENRWSMSSKGKKPRRADIVWETLTMRGQDPLQWEGTPIDPDASNNPRGQETSTTSRLKRLTDPRMGSSGLGKEVIQCMSAFKESTTQSHGQDRWQRNDRLQDGRDALCWGHTRFNTAVMETDAASQGQGGTLQEAG